MRSSTLLLVVALALACVALSSAEVDLSPRDILHRIASGGLLGPSAQMEMKRALRRLTPEQKQQLRKEADASQAAHLHARRNPAPRSSTRSPSAGPDFNSIPSVLNPFMQCRGITGLSVGIVQGGKLVYSNGFGVQDQSGKPVDADTLFGVGSVTKSFTAGLAAMAQQDGVFNFDANYRDCTNTRTGSTRALSGIARLCSLLLEARPQRLQGEDPARNTGITFAVRHGLFGNDAHLLCHSSLCPQIFPASR